MSADDFCPIHPPLTVEDLEVALKVAEVGVGTVDYPSDTVRLDGLAASLFGLPANVALPRARLHDRIHPDDWPRIEREVDALLAPCEETRVIDMSHRILLPDGGIRWVNARKQVVFDRAQQPNSGVFALVDITARVVAENRAQLLIGELNHRGKNLITVVSGIARQLKRHSAPEEVIDKLLDRLSALARNQDAISYRAKSGSSVHDVLVQQMTPFDDARRANVRMDGPHVTLSPGASQDFAMVMHELLTNATKYGALSVPDGTVDITWKITDGAEPALDLRWQERGGPDVTVPEHAGFGSRVLTQLAEASLGAKVSLDYRPRGLHFTFAAPLARLASD